MKNTREQIIQQAISYFTLNDYERASLNDIAGALGITKGGIYHYFKSKDELFKEVVLYTLEVIQNQFLIISERDESMSFKETLKVWYAVDDFSELGSDFIGFDMVGNYESTIYLLFAALKKFPEIHDKMKEMYTTLLRRLKALLDTAQAKGEIRSDLDTEALAFEICSYSEGSLLLGNFVIRDSINSISLRTFENIWNRIKA